MKNISYLAGGLFYTLLFWAWPAEAFHLDGLWRNDRQNITLRIEGTEYGFRAKRIDQGIWYKYEAHDNHYFTDRYGNYYKLLSDDELGWNEDSSGKKIFFTKVEKPVPGKLGIWRQPVSTRI